MATTIGTAMYRPALLPGADRIPTTNHRQYYVRVISPDLIRGSKATARRLPEMAGSSPAMTVLANGCDELTFSSGNIVERDRRRVRDIERVPRMARRQPHQHVAALARQAAHAFAFGAKHQRDARREIERGQFLLRLAVEAEAPEARVLQLFQRMCEIGDEHQRHDFERTRRR